MNTLVKETFEKVISSGKPVKIKLLGDSITHGVGGTGFQQNGEHIVGDFYRNPDGYCWAKLFKEHMEAQYSCTVTNNGCSGTNIQFTIEYFDQLVDADDDLIICTIGTNNRHQHMEDLPKHTVQEHKDIFYSNILKLHEQFQKAGKDVIFVANIPASAENEKDGPDYWRLIHMNDINALYTKAAEECGFPLISMYSAFLAYCESSGIEYDSLLADGLHPNDAGFAVMFRLLLEELGI